MTFTFAPVLSTRGLPSDSMTAITVLDTSRACPPAAFRPAPRWLALGALLAIAALATGCSTVENALAGDKVDYRSTTVRSAPLDVPPDLSQLSKESRFQTLPGGAISASVSPGATRPAAGVGVAAAPTAAGPVAITPVAVGGAAVGSAVPTLARIERAGDQRWLVSSLPPEQMWPRVKAFWIERGFSFTSEQPELGLLDTDWAENRAKLPQDALRRTLGRIFDSFYSTGERDRFRTRIERTAAGSEVFISHRGMVEVYTDSQRSSTAWQPRPTDPELEAEFLLRLAGALNGTTPASPPAASAAAGPAPAAAPAVPSAPPRARRVENPAGPALQLDDGFDRAWRRVGLALDRTGFTVEDRDRSQGVYFVRFVPLNPQKADEKGFFGRLFSSDASRVAEPQRLRVQVRGETDARSTVVVSKAQGEGDVGDSGQRVIGLLLEDLK